MIPIVTPEEMNAIDAAAPDPIDVLIDRAGAHVAWAARRLLGGVYGRRVVAIAGPGNNGADARVGAERLRRLGVHVQVVDPGVEKIADCDLVIDGALGTGLNRPFNPPAISSATPVLAVDIPSGVDGRTGEVAASALGADATVTFAALKPGLLLEPGASMAGQITVADIGLSTPGAMAHLFTAQDVARCVPQRKPTAHKWNHAVWVIGGSPGMYGAPSLAARAALRSGSGMVRCSIPGESLGLPASEVVFLALPEAQWHDSVATDAHRFGALVIGCGLGRGADTAASVQALISGHSRPVVLDADALRLLGPAPSLRPNIVLTPHDGEFEALTGAAPGPDRFASARYAASATGATVLLKGPLTIVADPGGQCLAVNEGDERLATAGTGDVLAGIIGSFLAAGVAPLEAAASAAWVHGRAGSTRAGFGMVASDLLLALPDTLTEILSPSTSGGANACN